MAETLVADIIEPPIFLDYVVERTAQLSALVQGGIIDVDPSFVQLANNGGSNVTMPFWQDLQGDDQVLSDTGALTTDKISTSADAAVIHNRGKSWSTNDLAGILAGDDPMQRIGDLVADYWQRKTQQMVIAMLTGIFSCASMAATNNADIFAAAGAGITDANCLHGSTFIDAKQLLGDAKDKLTAIGMHSFVESSLLKRNLIQFRLDSDGAVDLKTFQGLTVIVDDGCPSEYINSYVVFHTYLFGEKAIAQGVSTNNHAIQGGAPGSTWQLEFSRQALAGQNIMINRRRAILHPRGVKYLGAVQAGISPTNPELANGANWQRVFETKNVRLVRVRHNVLM